ncbi:hypothetical protein BD289DRAFT_45916 [Coniella lustricola]|uniref:Uncharacterized protein n=1 Tax=Coniella lustricola TaxID=2025994 RepID=A0A2T3A1J6_9PEZI|nr:hypothetical protein BD289DRAFT_45916 [Coniella lustricola]
MNGRNFSSSWQTNILAEARALSMGLFVTAIMARLISMLEFHTRVMETLLVLDRSVVQFPVFVIVLRLLSRLIRSMLP